MSAQRAPFLVTRSYVRPGEWALWRRSKSLRHCGYFDTQAEAIDFAYKNWPWR